MKQLDYERLLTTEWVNQFDDEQLDEIRNGLHENLDVGIYAKAAYDHRQMRQLRMGLEDGFDVTIFADPSIPWQEMLEARYQILTNLMSETLEERGAGVDDIRESIAGLQKLFDTFVRPPEEETT